MFSLNSKVRHFKFGMEIEFQCLMMIRPFSKLFSHTFNTFWLCMEIIIQDKCAYLASYLSPQLPRPIPRRGGGSSMFLTPPPGVFQKKAATAQAKKFWGPFFQKFDGFSKFFENLTVF